MNARPASYINWTSGDSKNVKAPPSTFLLTGWQPGQAPPPEYMNWAFYTLDQWVQYLDQETATGVPDGSIRLLGGGNWSFDATSGILKWDAAGELAIPSVPDSSNVFAASQVVLNDGDVAYLTPNNPIAALGTTFNGSPTMSPVNFTGNIQAGMNVTGPGIPNGTTVLGVGANSVTLSNNATSDNTGAQYVFANSGPITVSTTASQNLLPSTTVMLLARRAGNVVYLGINASQMVLRDGEIKTLDGSGYFSLYQAPAGQFLPQGTLVYISSGAADGGRTAGAAYPLDVSAANKAQRGTYAGSVITATLQGASATILYSGIQQRSGLTPGNYFADPTAPGGITPHEPTQAGQKILPIGFAPSASLLILTGGGGGGGDQNFPIFFQEPLMYGNGNDTTFPLSSLPLSAGATEVFIDGRLIRNNIWSLQGQNIVFTMRPGVGVEILVKYLLAGQAYLNMGQEIPTGLVDGKNLNYLLSGNPVNAASTSVYVDGAIIPPSQWNFVQGASGTAIVLNAPLALAQEIYVTYFTNTGPGATQQVNSGGTITGAANTGAGVGCFLQTAGSILKFRSIQAGTNTTVSDDGNGNIVISATPAAGGGAEVHGSKSAPVLVDPTQGIQATNAMDQVWWVKPSVSGSQPITATTAIKPGTIVGQRLALRGVSASDFLVIQDAQGTDLNGNANLDDKQAMTLFWDGINWSEFSRRN